MLKVKMALVAVVAFVFAIGGIATPTQAASEGFIRVIHASPDAPAVDIYLDNGAAPAIKALAFGSGTDFIALPAKSYSVQIRAAGAAASSAPVFTARFALGANRSVNVVALGLLASSKKADKFRLELIPLNRGATNGNARVQVIHASPDAPAVDVLAGGAAVVKKLAFTKFTPKSLDLPAGTYDLAVVPAGATSPVVINLAGTVLKADTIYTVVAIGKLANIKPVVFTTVSR